MAGQGGKVLLGLVAATAVIGTVILVTRPAAAAPALADVTGLVTDQAGAPLSGVLVNLGGFSTYTDDSGIFTFMGIMSGKYVMILSKPGYRTVIA